MNTKPLSNSTRPLRIRPPRTGDLWFYGLLFLGACTGAQAASAPVTPLRLDAAITEALTQGSRVLIGAARRDAAAARAGWRTSTYVPAVDLTLSATRSRYPRTLTSIRQPGVFPELDRDVLDVVAQMRWTVWDSGQGRYERRAVLSQARGADIALEMDRMETVERVSEAFLRLSLLQESQRVQHAHIQELRRRRSDIRSLLEEGRVARVDSLRIEEAVREAEMRAESLYLEIEHELNQLGAELEREQPPTLDELALFALGTTAALPTAAAEAVAEASPRLALAETRHETAQHVREATRRQHRPRLTAFAEHRTRTGADYDPDHEWIVGAAFYVPLFQPRLGAEGQARSAEAAEASLATQQARRALRVEAARLLESMTLAEERQAVANTRIAFLEEMVRVETRTYEEGRIALSEVLATRNRLEAARAERLGAVAEGRLLRLRHAVLEGSLTPERAVKITGEGS